MVLRRGQTITITDEIIELNKDRNGASFLDLLHDPAEQERRWNHVRIAPGAAPEHLGWISGSVEAQEAYELARERLVQNYAHDPDEFQKRVSILNASALGKAGRRSSHRSTPLEREWRDVLEVGERREY